jgi:hypothetical protein
MEALTSWWYECESLWDNDRSERGVLHGVVSPRRATRVSENQGVGKDWPLANLPCVEARSRRSRSERVTEARSKSTSTTNEIRQIRLAASRSGRPMEFRGENEAKGKRRDERWCSVVSPWG